MRGAVLSAVLRQFNHRDTENTERTEGDRPGTDG
jgi:hypothetical protein